MKNISSGRPEVGRENLFRLQRKTLFLVNNLASQKRAAEPPRWFNSAREQMLTFLAVASFLMLTIQTANAQFATNTTNLYRVSFARSGKILEKLPDIGGRIDFSKGYDAAGEHIEFERLIEWAELDSEGKQVFNFRETKRTDTSIELTDLKRNGVVLTIDLENKKVNYNGKPYWDITETTKHDATLIKFQDTLRFKLATNQVKPGEHAGRYLGDFKNWQNKKWPAMRDQPKAIKIFKPNDKGWLYKSKEYIKNGDNVIIRFVEFDVEKLHGDDAWSRDHRGKNFLDLAKGFGSCAWWEQGDGVHTTWTIYNTALDPADNTTPIKLGDSVVFAAQGWEEGMYLTPLEDKMVGVRKEPVAEKRSSWVLQPRKPLTIVEEAKANRTHNQVINRVVYIDNRTGPAKDVASETYHVELTDEVGIGTNTSASFEISASLGFQAGSELNFVTGEAGFAYSQEKSRASEQVKSKGFSTDVQVNYSVGENSETLVLHKISVPWSLRDIGIGGNQYRFFQLGGSLQYDGTDTIQIPSVDKQPIPRSRIDSMISDLEKVNKAEADRLSKSRLPVWIRNGWVTN